MKTVDQMTIEECKAMAYDALLQIQSLQRDIATLEQAIAQKRKEAEEKKDEKK